MIQIIKIVNKEQCKGHRGPGGPHDPKCCGRPGHPYFIFNAATHSCTGGKVFDDSNDRPQDDGIIQAMAVRKN